MKTIEDANDFFRSSIYFGFEELYIPREKVITAKSDDQDFEVSSMDFVLWQIERMQSETIYYIINKIDFSLDSFMDADNRYAHDEPYDPDSWLSEYDEETKNNGIALINRMRRENTEEFYNELVTGVLSEDCGLSTHAQADILRDFDLISDFNEWPVKIGIIFTGSFHPYIEAGSSENLKMDEFELKQIWIRNYDE